MRKRGIFICILVTIGVQLSAQKVSHEVIVPAGMVSNNGGYSVSQTIGEPMVKIIGDDEFCLIQGFQQPSSGLRDILDGQGNGVKAYPNPVKDNLNLEIFGERSIDFHVTIFGFTGAIYFRKDYSCVGNFHHLIHLNVRDYQRGTYFLRVVAKDGTISRLFKIEKI